MANQEKLEAAVDQLLEALGENPEREGLVFKSETKHDVSFKAISNRWLLKGGE